MKVETEERLHARSAETVSQLGNIIFRSGLVYGVFEVFGHLADANPFPNKPVTAVASLALGALSTYMHNQQPTQ